MTVRGDYWNGPDAEDRRIKYAKDFKPEFQANGENLMSRFRNVVTYVCGQFGFELPERWSSGWRPPAVNEATANAAKGASTHLTAEGGDWTDTIDGALAWALFKDPHPLQVHGLYIEHPVATVVRSWELAYQKWKKASFKGDCPAPMPWCHAQTRQPASGNRVYWPDGKAMGEWQAFLKMGGHAGMSFADWLPLRRAADKVSSTEVS